MLAALSARWPPPRGRTSVYIGNPGLIVVVIASITSLSSASFGQAFVRMELRPIESTTLTGEHFLTGDKSGKLVMLAGELRIPT